MITTDQTEIAVSAAVHPPLPSTNLYFMAIMRILDVKTGPFHEHSSQLHSIALGVPNWSKVNSGLFKMYQVRNLVGLHITYLSYSSFDAAGGGVRETSCRTAYSVRGFVGMGAQRSRTSRNCTSSDRAMDIYTASPYPYFKYVSTKVDSVVMPKSAELKFISAPNELCTELSVSSVTVFATTFKNFGSVQH